MLNLLSVILSLFFVSAITAQSTHRISTSLRANIAKKMPSQNDIQKLKEKNAAKEKDIEKDRETIGKNWDEYTNSLNSIRKSRREEHEKVAKTSIANPKGFFTGASSMSNHYDDLYEKRLKDFNQFVDSVYKDPNISAATKEKIDDEFTSHLKSLVGDSEESRHTADANAKVAIGHLANIRDLSVAAAGAVGAIASKGKAPKAATGAMVGAAAGAAYDLVKGHVGSWTYANAIAKEKDLSFSEMAATYLEKRGANTIENKHPTGALTGAAIGAGTAILPARALSLLKSKPLVAGISALSAAGVVNEFKQAKELRSKAEALDKNGKHDEATNMRAEAEAAEAVAYLDGAIVATGTIAGIKQAASKGNAIAKPSVPQETLPQERLSHVPLKKTAAPNDVVPTHGRTLPSDEASDLATELRSLNKKRTSDAPGSLSVVSSPDGTPIPNNIFVRGSGRHPDTNRISRQEISGKSVYLPNVPVLLSDSLVGKKVLFKGSLEKTLRSELKGTVLGIDYANYTVVVEGPHGIHFQVPWAHLERAF